MCPPHVGCSVADEVQQGIEIYGEGETVEYVYEVVSGAVRIVKVLSDWRRQIEWFNFAETSSGLRTETSTPFPPRRLSARPNGAQPGPPFSLSLLRR